MFYKISLFPVRLVDHCRGSNDWFLLRLSRRRSATHSDRHVGFKPSMLWPHDSPSPAKYSKCQYNFWKVTLGIIIQREGCWWNLTSDPNNWMSRLKKTPLRTACCPVSDWELICLRSKSLSWALTVNEPLQRFIRVFHKWKGHRGLIERQLLKNRCVSSHSLSGKSKLLPSFHRKKLRA